MTTTTSIDSGIVTEVVNMIKSVCGVFTVFPLNVIIICSLAGIAFGLFKKGKRAAH